MAPATRELPTFGYALEVDGRPKSLNAHENEPTFAQFSGPTECAGLSNVRVLFRVVDRLVDWKREARFCIDGHDSPFAWSR
jgi:hypothetical protein